MNASSPASDSRALPGNITVYTDLGAQQLPAGSTVADLLDRLIAASPHLSHCATAVNGEFVSRHARAAYALHEGDTLLCFSPITGG